MQTSSEARALCHKGYQGGYRNVDLVGLEGVSRHWIHHIGTIEAANHLEIQILVGIYKRKHKTGGVSQ
jgi:hypothetical protein